MENENLWQNVMKAFALENTITLPNGVVITLAPDRCFGNVRRSPKWQTFRRVVVTEVPYCQICGGRTLLQVHHKQPYHLWPEKELDRDNCCVLCEADTRCHLWQGHLGNWKNYNPLIDDLIKLVKAPMSERATNETTR